MLKAKPRNLNDAFVPGREVTNFKPLDNNGRFTMDGVFSERIFGNMSNGVDYSCDCCCYQGEFNLGFVCDKCGTPVTYKGLMLSREGWIDLKLDLIHPVFFQYLKKIIGPTALQNILKYKPKREMNGEIVEVPVEPPYYNIGMINFIEHFDEIIEHYYRTKSKNPSRDNAYKMISDPDSNLRDLVFMDKFPIVNARLRPATLVNGEFTFDEISNCYNNIIRNAQEIATIPEIQMTDDNILDLVYKNQMLVNQVFERILDNLSNKEGFIRGSLIGSRLNFTSRAVITPLPAGHSMDECLMPYRVAIEIMKPMIIQKLVKLRKVTISKASRLWFEATLEPNKTVLAIMREIASQDNVRIILNRNPTIAVGSMLLLRIADIKEDFDDVTLSINNIVLPPLSGDYDGGHFS